jgi:cytidylate kinase
MSNKRITIALDGHSSTGKSTLAKALAHNLDYTYIDTGAMYRAVAYLVHRHHLLLPNGKPDRDALKKLLPSNTIDFRSAPGYQMPVVHLNGLCIEPEIRTMEVSNLVSHVATLDFVREALVKQQQEMGKAGGVVMDGRDIGTVVFPKAELKIFMTASSEIRAKRRWEELRDTQPHVTYQEVLENVTSRDHIDSTRDVSPLRQAPDARVLDNSHMTREAQLQTALDWAKAVISK